MLCDPTMNSQCVGELESKGQEEFKRSGGDSRRVCCDLIELITFWTIDLIYSKYALRPMRPLYDLTTWAVV